MGDGFGAVHRHNCFEISGTKWHPQSLKIITASATTIRVVRWRGNDGGWNSNLARAKVHLANHDERAAGVYARDAFEGKLKKYCEDKKVAVQYQSNQSKMTTEMFWLGIKAKLGTDGKLADVQAQISAIEVYRKVVLNPLSHENPTTLTEVEIHGAIAAIEDLDKVLK